MRGTLKERNLFIFFSRSLLHCGIAWSLRPRPNPTAPQFLLFRNPKIRVSFCSACPCRLCPLLNLPIGALPRTQGPLMLPEGLFFLLGAPKASRVAAGPPPAPAVPQKPFVATGGTAASPYALVSPFLDSRERQFLRVLRPFHLLILPSPSHHVSAFAKRAVCSQRDLTLAEFHGAPTIFRGPEKEPAVASQGGSYGIKGPPPAFRGLSLSCMAADRQAAD